MPIDADEFQRWMVLLRTDMKDIGDRLDLLNGRTRDTETAIAVLQDRSANGIAAAWGGGVAGVIVGLIEGLRWVLG